MAGDPHQAPGPAAEPGVHEIVLTVPADGVLCNSLTCARQGKPAEVVVTFGRLSGRWFDPGAVAGVLGQVVPELRRVLGPGPTHCAQAPAGPGCA